MSFRSARGGSPEAGLEVTLAPLTRGDVDALHALIEDERRALEREDKRGFLAGRSRGELLELLGSSEREPWGPKGLCVGARSPDGALMGACVLTLGATGSTRRVLESSGLPVEPQRVLTSSALTVHPSLRGRGLGARLHAAMAELASQRDEPLLLTVNSRNPSSLRVALRHGALLVDLAPSLDHPGAWTLLLAAAQPEALGLTLDDGAARFPLQAPIEAWLSLLQQGHVGRLEGDTLVFHRRAPLLRTG